MVGGKVCQSDSNTNGKLGIVQPHQPSKQPLLTCPECGSKKLWRAGLRYLAEGRTVQRWLCRKCGYASLRRRAKI